jgi:hypothetical protein
MGRRKHVPRQTSADDDFAEDGKMKKQGTEAPVLLLPELDEEFDENSQDGSLAIGDGCFLTQHPSGYGPDC